jgi:hypothetical protein
MRVNRRKVLVRSGMIFLLLMLPVSFMGGSVLTQNSDQKQIYDFTILHPGNQTYVYANGTATGTDYANQAGMKVEIAYVIHQIVPAPGSASASFIWSRLFADPTLLGQGFVADCAQFCYGGINYYLDPTTLITNQGVGAVQCLIFGATTTDTCTAGNFPKVEGFSVDTHTPAAGDTWAGGATIPCSSSNVIVDGNGLIDVAGTLTTAANAATITATIAHTFTATGSYTAVQVSCLLTALASGTNPLIFAEGTFGPDSFVSGDTIAATWTVAMHG